MADSSNLMQRVLGSPRLPSLPAIAMQIIDLVQRDDVAVDDIAEAISLDAALSSKVLKTVNSSFYGQAKTISSIQQAVVVLGLNSVKTLALGFSLVNNLTEAGGDGLDLIHFWKRSLFSATAAKRLCELTNVIQMEEVFLAALLQDVGVLALGQVLGEQYSVVLERAEHDHRQLARHETELLGSNHAEIGEALVSAWGLPPLLVTPIRYHETPDKAPENMRHLVRVIAAGAAASELMISPDDEQRAADYVALMQRWFNIGREPACELLGSFVKQSGEMQRLFELPAGDLGSPDQIMAKASEILERVALESSIEKHQLEESNRELKKQVYLDALTGVSNRRHFDEKICEHFLEAGPDRPLALMFLDIDHFKGFNDQFGHATGDAALACFTQCLTQAVGEAGAAYRYGGEEFAILCPGLDRRNAAELAERIRVAVESAECPGPASTPLKITTSIGVAVYEGEVYRKPEQLVQAADSSVYAAKKAGRNCVRVFVPRATQAA